ncbi:MAG TPA: YraN family protein [Bacteroidales bacterium]|nr:YraN family protein [Bacteroidales bacterium]
MAEHLEIGIAGEDAAARYLVKHGYKIRHRNWHFSHKELDLITSKDNLLVVVEVKSRTSEMYQNPHEAVTNKKQRFIVDATERYMEIYNINMEVRFDVVEVVFYKKVHKINHIIEAFNPQIE